MDMIEFARRSNRRRKRRGPVKATTRRKISRALTGRDGDGDGKKNEAAKAAALGIGAATLIGGGALAMKRRNRSQRDLSTGPAMPSDGFMNNMPKPSNMPGMVGGKNNVPNMILGGKTRSPQDYLKGATNSTTIGNVNAGGAAVIVGNGTGNNQVRTGGALANRMNGGALALRSPQGQLTRTERGGSLVSQSTSNKAMVPYVPAGALARQIDQTQQIGSNRMTVRNGSLSINPQGSSKFVNTLGDGIAGAKMMGKRAIRNGRIARQSFNEGYSSQTNPVVLRAAKMAGGFSGRLNGMARLIQNARRQAKKTRNV